MTQTLKELRMLPNAPRLTQRKRRFSSLQDGRKRL